jgi:arginase
MNNTQLSATLIGVPINVGANNLGVDMGPNAYRYQDIVPKLQRAGLKIADAGNVQCRDRWNVPVGDNSKLRYLEEVVRISNDTAQQVQNALHKGDKAIVLGGDHTTCLGAVSGASVAVNGDIGLIYFDAHGDMNTDQTTPSGNIHGMQLASLMGFGASQLAHVHDETTKVHPKNVLHIGGCDMDQAEKDLISREKIAAFSMDDVMTHTLAPLLPMIDKLQSQVKHIWVSLDLDSIDEQYAPAAGMPNKKGLVYREIAMLAQYIGQHCTVVGVDIVEYNPLIDIDRKTAGLATELIASFFGKEYNWYTDYLARNK